MNWKTQTDDERQALLVLCSGNFSLEDLTMLAIEASFLVREHDHAAVLIDLSEAELSFPAFHLRSLLDVYAENSLPPATRTGILLGARHASRNFSQLLSAAKEYGYPLALLADQEQVKLWLAGD